MIRVGTAIVVALLAAAALLASPRESPLPALGWAAGFLFLFVEEDMRNRRIPNWLTVTALAVALIVGAASGGLPGVAQAMAGALTALVLLIVPFAMRGLGAGDVKALMALGALWGPVAILGSLPWMLISGGVLALGILAVRGRIPDLLQRWGVTLTAWTATQRWHYVTPSAREGGLPFALAIALGASAYQFWGPPWL